MTGQRIIVDGIFFSDSSTGIARVWTEILRYWQSSPIGERVILLNRGRLPSELSKLKTVDCSPLDLADQDADRLRLQQICDRWDAGLFISTYFTRPQRTPSLLLVHDMIPEALRGDLTQPKWIQKRDAIAHASAFACVSQNTLNDLMRFYPDAARRPAIVVHNGVSPAFHTTSEQQRRDFQNSFVAINLGGRPYIMFVGHLSVRYKNGKALFQALHQVDCSNRALLLTDTTPRATTIFRRVPGLEVFAARLSEDDLARAYACADCLVYPSLYEGFGMPIVEAMASGCPVISSNRSALPEIAGDAALLVDPHNPTELAQALIKIGAPAFRAGLIERGLARARTFSWNESAAKLAALASYILERTTASRTSAVSTG